MTQSAKAPTPFESEIELPASGSRSKEKELFDDSKTIRLDLNKGKRPSEKQSFVWRLSAKMAQIFSLESDDQHITRFVIRKFDEQRKIFQYVSRKELIKYEYPLPHYCKKVGWCFYIVILFSSNNNVWCLL